jgi:hypothetical protein
MVPPFSFVFSRSVQLIASGAAAMRYLEKEKPSGLPAGQIAVQLFLFFPPVAGEGHCCHLTA